MNRKNEKCPSSADGKHKPDPAFCWVGRDQVALDERDQTVKTTVLCVACGAPGTAVARVDQLEWGQSDPHASRR